MGLTRWQMGDLRAGKLVQAKRHNYVPDVSSPGADLHRVVTETLVCGGRGEDWRC